MNLNDPKKEIRAFYTDETIRVYQAYNKVIAEEAVRNAIEIGPEPCGRAKLFYAEVTADGITRF